MTTDKSEINILPYARARDEILDQWLATCGDMDRALTARWLLDGNNQENMPRALVRAQEKLMEVLSQ